MAILKCSKQLLEDRPGVIISLHGYFDNIIRLQDEADTIDFFVNGQGVPENYTPIEVTIVVEPDGTPRIVEWETIE